MNKNVLSKTVRFTFIFITVTFLADFSARAQMISTYAGNGVNAQTVPGPLNANTSFSLVDALAMDAAGNLYVGSEENKIFQITPGGTISLFAGSGGFTAAGDGGPAVNASISRPRHMIFDAAGNLYFTASWANGNHSVRMINTAGIISTIAGTGVMGFSGDGGQATAAQIAFPFGLAFDSNGDLYITEGFQGVGQEGNRIRKIDMGTGIITTIAGTGVGGDSGNGGLAINAQIWTNNIAIDPSDNIYIQNVSNGGVRKIDQGTGIITNYAGNGTYGYSGDGGQAVLAQFGYINDMHCDAAGNLYFTEGSNSSNLLYDNNTLRKIAVSGIVSTVAGDGNLSYGFSGDGSAPTYAQMYEPNGFVFSNSGNEIYIADEINFRIRKIDLLAVPICPNIFSVVNTYNANGQVVITPSITPFTGTPDYIGTITGDPNYNPLTTININTNSTYTANLPGNGNYPLTLTYVDTISSMVCTRSIVDTLTITNSLTPRAFNRKFRVINSGYCNTGSPYFTDSTVFKYSLSNPLATYTIVTNWGNGSIVTTTVSATDQILVSSSPTNYVNPGAYTVQSILSGGGVANDTAITTVYIYPCGNLTGTLFNDIDNDCAQQIFNNEFPIINNVPLLATDGGGAQYFTWSTGGSYNFVNMPVGTYTIEVLTGTTGYSITCANSMAHTTTVITAQTTVENFALNCSGGFDIATTGISLWGGFFPGQFDMILPHVGILNGTCDFVIPGQVKMVLTPCIQYVPGGGNTNTPDQIIPAVTGDTLVWNVSDLNAIGNFGYYNYAVSVSTCTNAVVGDTACITMMVLPTNGDVNMTNNTFTQCFAIGVSFDPNYKEVSPAGNGVQGYIPATTNDLTYTLHFQNTGTAKAFNIALLDTISTNLDLYSIEILSSSHYVQPYLLPGRTVKFMFANINLPDSTSDEPNSHGYVTYRIKLNSGLAPGTEIKNTCYIYFDYNSAVVTNTTLNTINLTTGIEQNVVNGFDVFPNPASDRITVKLSKVGSGLIVLYDILGNEVQRFPVLNGSTEISTEDLENGVYVISVMQDNRQTTKKVIVSK